MVEGTGGWECEEGILGSKAPDGRAISSDGDFADYLLEAAHLAAVPGLAFGLSPFFRISYAASETKLEEASSRPAAACVQLT